MSMHVRILSFYQNNNLISSLNFWKSQGSMYQLLESKCSQGRILRANPLTLCTCNTTPAMPQMLFHEDWLGLSLWDKLERGTQHSQARLRKTKFVSAIANTVPGSLCHFTVSKYPAYIRGLTFDFAGCLWNGFLMIHTVPTKDTRLFGAPIKGLSTPNYMNDCAMDTLSRKHWGREE